MPIQSRTCQHSVCAVCIESVRQEKSTSGASVDGFISCHDCHAENAFHTKDPRAMSNGLACAALIVMEKLKRKLEKYQDENNPHPNSLNEAFAKENIRISPGSSYEENDTEGDTKAISERRESAGPVIRKQDVMTALASSSKGSSSLTKSSGKSYTDTSPSISAALGSYPNQQYFQQANRPMLVSPSPGERKLVWVKFDKGSHLAYLLSVNGDAAKIRWESNKFEEVVSVDVLEEIELRGSPSERPKRNRQGNSKVANSECKSDSSRNHPKGRKSSQTPSYGKKLKVMKAT